ncbi:CG14545 [Drosophila busckii]|uniref:CG14545 n=1 Tax=Drosophila busckii TaxID=30019 RepID=A0A0M4EN34_DROBS|nr:uncharacterized protein LOC108602640 [Drosophila busckii]ALC46952.1 CG14545 [Drosophila busckii]
MSSVAEEYSDYLNKTGVMKRLVEILEHLVEIDPLPVDPLMEILHALGCPLIPQAQIKALEREVSHAQDELRYLRRVLINIGGRNDLYDSDTDEDEYVGVVGTRSGVAQLYALESGVYNPDQSPCASPVPYLLTGAKLVKKEEKSQH